MDDFTTRREHHFNAALGSGERFRDALLLAVAAEGFLAGTLDPVDFIQGGKLIAIPATSVAEPHADGEESLVATEGVAPKTAPADEGRAEKSAPAAAPPAAKVMVADGAARPILTRRELETLGAIETLVATNQTVTLNTISVRINGSSGNAYGFVRALKDKGCTEVTSYGPGKTTEYRVLRGVDDVDEKRAAPKVHRRPGGRRDILNPEQKAEFLRRCTTGESARDIFAEFAFQDVAQAERYWGAHKPPGRFSNQLSGKKPFVLSGAYKRIFEMLEYAAKEKCVAPTNGEITKEVRFANDSCASGAVKVLEREGLIEVERRGKTRVITICSSGEKTADPDYGYLDDLPGAAPRPAVPVSRETESAPPAEFEAPANEAAVLAFLVKHDHEATVSGLGLYTFDGELVTFRQLVGHANNHCIRLKQPLFTVPDLDLPSGSGMGGPASMLADAG